MLWGASAAFAQTPGAPSSPAGGLFGGAVRGAAADRSLNLSMSLVEAFDDDLQGDVTGIQATSARSSGFYTALTPNLDVASRGRRVQVNATIGSNMRYYGDLNRLVSVGHSAAGGFSAQLTRRTTLSLSQSISYAPSSSRLFGLFASAAPADIKNVVDAAGNSAIDPATDSAVTSAARNVAGSERSYVYGTTLGLTHAVTQRATLTFDSGFRYTDFNGPPGLMELRSYHGGGRFSYRVSRDASVRLGYAYRQAVYSAANEPVTHDIDVGIDYLWPLTHTRKTTLGFSVGSTVLSGPLQEGAVLNAERTQYRAVGDASLTHQIGRTWRVQGLYHRGLGFVPGLTSAVSTNALTVTTDGFLNRRTDVLASAAYSTGDSPLSGRPSEFKTYTGDARVRFALTRTWATYVEYLYYLYDFNPSLQLPPGMSPHLRRNSARVGLTLWLPLRQGLQS